MTKDEMKVNIKDVENHIKQLEEQCEDWKADHKHNLELMKGLNNRIADLEKENAELRNNGFTVSAMTEQQLKIALEKGEQLEKENAELKEELKDANEKVVHLACNQNKDLKHKLTKATEIIKKYYKYNPSCEYPYKDIDKEAEQFIKEIEE